MFAISPLEVLFSSQVFTIGMGGTDSVYTPQLPMPTAAGGFMLFIDFDLNNATQMQLYLETHSGGEWSEVNDARERSFSVLMTSSFTGWQEIADRNDKGRHRATLPIPGLAWRIRADASGTLNDTCTLTLKARAHAQEQYR